MTNCSFRNRPALWLATLLWPVVLISVVSAGQIDPREIMALANSTILNAEIMVVQLNEGQEDHTNLLQYGSEITTSGWTTQIAGLFLNKQIDVTYYGSYTETGPQSAELTYYSSGYFGSDPWSSSGTLIWSEEVQTKRFEISGGLNSSGTGLEITVGASYGVVSFSASAEKDYAEKKFTATVTAGAFDIPVLGDLVSAGGKYELDQVTGENQFYVTASLLFFSWDKAVGDKTRLFRRPPEVPPAPVLPPPLPPRPVEPPRVLPPWNPVITPPGHIPGTEDLQPDESLYDWGYLGGYAFAGDSWVDPSIATDSAVLFGGNFAHGVLDTVTLMGPGGMYPYRGDFETASARPGGSGTPTDGWTTFDETSGVGDFARVWSLLGDADGCASNYSKLVAFIDDGLVVPGTGGTVGSPGNDYGPPGGYIVNNTGGLLGPAAHLRCSIWSPVMTMPGPAMDGLSLEFDVYRHELLVPNDTPGTFYAWSVRSTAGGDISTAVWRDRNFVYYGGPSYRRSTIPLDDLILPGCTQVQVKLGVVELGSAFGFGDGTNGTPAPYFDNVCVRARPRATPFLATPEICLANDGFPAGGVIDLGDLSRNAIRFDMAANISPRSHLRNDPGDSICVDAVPRAGGVLATPVMHFTFARKNPLFDAYRTEPASPVAGSPTYSSSGIQVPNRFNFDLPDGSTEDGSMLFPGDILHYYIEATDDVAGDIRTATIPADLTGFGDPTSMVWPGSFTVRCLPSLRDAAGDQPVLLFWNDFGFGAGEAEWYGALRALGLQLGVDYDVYTTHGPASGVGNGLGGRASVDQIAGYTDLLYTTGDLGALTLSNGDYNCDPGNDLGLMNSWFMLGGRDALMTGDDLASSLASSGAVAAAFLENRLGLTFIDSDIRDNIAGQTAPLVVWIPGNPVFTSARSWVAYGGCFAINDFDNCMTGVGATRLAQFTEPGGVATPYPQAAAVLNVTGGNRVVSMNHDLRFVSDPGKAPAPLPARTVLLSNVLDYFGVPNDPGNLTDVLPAGRTLSIATYPNPFNPSLTIRFTITNPGIVVMKVFNVRGELVKTLYEGPVAETAGNVVWDGTDDQGSGVASGVYFVEIRARDEVKVAKAVMVR